MPRCVPHAVPVVIRDRPRDWAPVRVLPGFYRGAAGLPLAMFSVADTRIMCCRTCRWRRWSRSRRRRSLTSLGTIAQDMLLNACELALGPLLCDAAALADVDVRPPKKVAPEEPADDAPFHVAQTPWRTLDHPIRRRCGGWAKEAKVTQNLTRGTIVGIGQGCVRPASIMD